MFSPQFLGTMMGMGYGARGLTPNPEDDYPRRPWPFPWPWWRFAEQFGPHPEPWRGAATVILSVLAAAEAHGPPSAGNGGTTAGGQTFLKEFIDDYCGNIPRPKPGPQPEPWAILALVSELDALGSRLTDGSRMKQRLNEVNEQLLGNLAKSFNIR